MGIQDENEKTVVQVASEHNGEAGETIVITAGSGQLHRKLNAGQVQLFGIGAAIGTGIFVAMGSYLPTGGPAGLLLAFIVWGFVGYCINQTYAEMVCHAPVPAPFVRFDSEWVDDALGFAVSWSFLLSSCFLVPFEITALQRLIGFWTDKMPVEAMTFIVLFLYGLLNCVSVKWFGVAEFYLAIGKVFIIFFLFSFVSRWQPNPRSLRLPILERAKYISLVAAETKMPRRVLPAAYNSFPFRLLFFFVGSALALGICVPYNDPTLNGIISGDITGSGTAAASPYIILMERLKISGLPHFINAVFITSVFSAGNGYVFCASRTLYTMAEQGRAPRFFTKTTGNGVPIWAALFCLMFCLLALLNVKSSTAEVMGYFVDLVTTNQLLNYATVCITHLHFYAAMKKQGRSRESLPYKGWLQPYAAYIGLVATSIMAFLLGFSIFFPGEWSVKWFFLDYTFLALFPTAVVVWKVVYKTNYKPMGTADLSLGGEVQEIDAYEELVGVEPLTGFSGWMERIFGGVWDRKTK